MIGAVKTLTVERDISGQWHCTIDAWYNFLENSSVDDGLSRATSDKNVRDQELCALNES